MLGILLLTLLVVGAVIAFQLQQLRKGMISANVETGQEVESLSSQAMEVTMEDNLLRLTSEKAAAADTLFFDFGKKVSVLAESAQYLYEHEADFGEVKVHLPDQKNGTALDVYVTYSEKVDQDDPAFQDEQGLVGNLQGELLAVTAENEEINSDYFASESGFMLQADDIYQGQFDEAGNLLTFEAKDRPWYQGAVAQKGIYFTDPTHDVSTGDFAIMCSAPVYQQDQLVGVAGAGMYLSSLKETVAEAVIGEAGSACLIDGKGNIIFSTRESGELAAGGAELANVLQGTQGDLNGFLTEAVNGAQAVSLIPVDGENVYVSCAPLETVGWTLLSVLPEEEVTAPTRSLTDALSRKNSEMLQQSDRRFLYAFVTLLIAMALLVVVAYLLSRRLSSRLVRPIVTLTNKVREIEGDNLSFTWDQHTHDEIDVLASSFGTMTERIEKYIVDITTITAEKERIGAELSVATQIQADMLPCIFPAFPERKEFDIFASMSPAKEVGGDFYDFFLLDDDHLAMVMADVSGKGVPAALFMVISKTIIKNQAQFLKSPKQILETANNLLQENNAEDMFVTVWLGIMEISTGRLQAVNAGHEYPVIRGANGQFELLKDKHGMVLGTMPGMKYREYEAQIEEGGCLFLYTDGVAEATNANNELYGTDRMLAALNREPMASPKQLLVNVRADIDAFVGTAPQFDDITMLAMERKKQ